MKAFGHNGITVRASIAFAAMALGTTLAHAQATRTWVSGVGDDANPCSRTAPCKTWAGAISKTAPSGEIDALDPGGFGAVTITKAITLDGGSGIVASILVSGGSNAILIAAGANDVVSIKNLSFNGLGQGVSPAGSGIRITAAAEVNVENCTIFEFGQKGIDINPTTSLRVNIKNSTVRGCAQGAVHAHPGTGGLSFVTIGESHILASSFGVRGEDRVVVTLDTCNVSGNSGDGIHSEPVAASTLINANNCVITDNGGVGVTSVKATSTVRLSNCTISANTTGVSSVTSGVVASYGNNRIKGNVADGAPATTIGQQ